MPRGSAGGLTQIQVPTLVPTWATIEDTVTIALGGRAADVVLGSGANAGAGTDLAGATQLLVDAIERQGLGDTLVHVPEARLQSAKLSQMVDAHLKRLLQRAISIVEADRDLAQLLAERLASEKVLSGQEVNSAMKRRQRRMDAKLPTGKTMSGLT